MYSSCVNPYDGSLLTTPVFSFDSFILQAWATATDVERTEIQDFIVQGNVAI